MFSADTFRKLWPHARAELIAAVVAQGPTLFPKFGLDAPLTVAHAMAQFSHECGADTEGVENLNYSAQGLVNTWPRHFDVSNALMYAHNPRKLANFIYEPPNHNDLGNTANTDDGWNYRGEGGPQTTGKDGYAKLAAQTGLDLINNPGLINEPEHWLTCALADFVNCGCLPFAKRDDIHGVTLHLNGGLIGLSERRAWLAKWKAALDAEGHTVVEPPRDTNAARIGDSGPHVEAAQQQLADKGYPVGNVDGDFGTATRGAVVTFQADNGLPATGEIDAATRAALPAAPQKPVSEDRATSTADDLRAAGSQTIQHADNASTTGKVVAGAGAVGAVAKTGIFDKIQELTDQFATIKPVIGAVQDLAQWGASHWYFGAAAAGFASWYCGKQIIARRVADRQSGAHMGK